MADVTQTIGQKAMNMFNRMVGGQKSGVNRGFGDAFSGLMGWKGLKGMGRTIRNGASGISEAAEGKGGEIAKDYGSLLWRRTKDWATGADRARAGANGWQRAGAIGARAAGVGGTMAAIDFFNPFGFGWND